MMKFVLIGPGQLGRHLLQAAVGERLVIGKTAEDAERLAHAAGAIWTADKAQVVDGDVIAVAVPAEETCSVLFEMAKNVLSGALVLNFATAVSIPDEIQESRPDVHWLEAKMVGSAVGMEHGMRCAIALGTTDTTLLERVQKCFPSLSDSFLLADPTLAPKANTMATKAALRAAIALEEELTACQMPQPLIDAALGCAFPGVVLSYQKGTLGGFAQKIVQQIRAQSDNI